MRILFVCPYIPSHIRVRSFNFLRVLSEFGHEVTLVALQPPGESAESLPEIHTWCKAVHVIPLSRQQTLVNGVRGLLGSLPIQAAYSQSDEFNHFIRELLAKETFDVAHIEHLRGVVLTDALGKLPMVFDSVDSIALLLEKTLAEGPNLKSRMMAQLDLGRTRHFEGQLTQRFPYVAVCSELDRKRLIELGNDAERLVYVPSCVDTAYYHPMNVERDPLVLTFTGKMSYHANIAAATDLVQHIMPLVWAQEPNARLQIVGKDPPPAIEALAEDPRIIVTGFVPDLRPYLAQSAAAISFVRYGVGLTTKVIQSMAMGTPVVATPFAVSTLNTEHGKDVLVGKDYTELAEHIVSLIRSADLRTRIGEAGRRYVEQFQTWEGAVKRLETMYANAIQEQSEAFATADAIR